MSIPTGIIRELTGGDTASARHSNIVGMFDLLTGFSENGTYLSNYPSIYSITYDPLHRLISDGGIQPPINKEPGSECYLSHDKITSTYFECTNPIKQHCVDAEMYIAYIKTTPSFVTPMCTVCRTYEMDPKLKI